MFADDEDFEHFLALVACASQVYRTDVHEYGLMDTHYHMIVTPHDALALREAVSYFAGQYSRYYNHKYGRMGTLINERYRDGVIRDERQWFTCMRYIVRNPVAAGIVTAPGDYRWSSYRCHAYGQPVWWLKDHALYTALGPDPATRQAAYRAICDPP